MSTYYTGCRTASTAPSASSTLQAAFATEDGVSVRYTTPSGDTLTQQIRGRRLTRIVTAWLWALCHRLPSEARADLVRVSRYSLTRRQGHYVSVGRGGRVWVRHGRSMRVHWTVDEAGEPDELLVSRVHCPVSREDVTQYGTSGLAHILSCMAWIERDECEDLERVIQLACPDAPLIAS